MELLLAVLTAVLDEDGRPVLRAGALGESFVLDGRLSEPEWEEADVLQELTQVDPREFEEPSEKTRVRVLADAKRIVFGVRCHDTRPDLIIARTTERDAGQGGEDRVKIILDPYLDGRSGYLFVVNPLGARYDALVSRNGASENRDWNAIWEARTTQDEEGWTAEIAIPIESLGFRRGARRWFFNLERRLERNQEIDRWASPSRNYHLNQTGRGGYLDGLPDFDYGIGLTARPAVVAKIEKPPGASSPRQDVDASLDLSQRLAPELLLSFTFNTDFSETEVDTRQSNLTRFPLYFPEKRAFFLEGADLFEFGLDRSADALPFYSRRVGLVDGLPLPLEAGGKLSGRVDQTSVGALAARVGEEEGVAPGAELGVLRLKQNFLEQSYVGLLGTAGDPLGRDDAATLGADAAYQTSKLFDDLNFQAGAYALGTDREELAGPGDASYGAFVGLPNDTLELALSWKRIGAEFDPALGFVPRAGVHRYRGSAAYRYRPGLAGVRALQTSLDPSLVTGLDGHWESFTLRWSALDVELDSGDAFGLQAAYAGDRPEASFEVAPGVGVEPGDYAWVRWRPVLGTATRRPLSASLSYDAGEYYDGRLTKIDARAVLNAHGLVTISGGAERSAGELPGGAFRRDFLYGRLRVNAGPDVSLSVFAQCDTDSRDLGFFSRFRWTMTPHSDVFLVYSYDWLEEDGRLDPLAYDGAMKVQYTWRF